jgi:AmiR/NasT family two-component response regulator
MGTMMDSLTLTDHSLTGTRALDTGKGVLVVLRRCSAAEAFAEIVSVAVEYRVGALELSRALVELAQGSAPTVHGSAADEAAHRAWATLLE